MTWRDLPMTSSANATFSNDHDDLALRGGQLLEQQADECRLTGAGVPHEEHELARIDLHVDVAQRGLLGSVGLPDVAHHDHGRATPGL